MSDPDDELPPTPAVTSAPTPHTLITCTLALALLALIGLGGGLLVAVAWPRLQAWRQHANEVEAIAALEVIARAQAEYRVKTAEDPELDARYGDLQALGQAMLLPPSIAAGLHHGYVLEVVTSRAHPERWMATAAPLDPGRTGLRCFATCQSGQLVYRPDRPILLDAQDCALPPDALPVGAGPPRR